MFYTLKNDNIYLNVRVTTKSSRNCIAGLKNDELAISVTAAPENNKANEAIITLIAKKLKIAKSKVQIVTGEKCRSKKICISAAMNEINMDHLAVISEK
jgi:uncharacterized protein (TIGR00251 family)